MNSTKETRARRFEKAKERATKAWTRLHAARSEWERAADAMLAAGDVTEDEHYSMTSDFGGLGC